MRYLTDNFHMDSKPLTYCAAGCKRSVPTDEELQNAWDYLEIQKRWRCPQCSRELRAVNERKEDGQGSV